MEGTIKPEMKVPAPMPPATIPVAKPRRFITNQAAARVIAGTFAAPLPKPVRSLIRKATPKLWASPVRIMVIPISTRANVIAILGRIGRETSDDRKSRVTDEVSGSEQSQLSVSELKPVFHAGKNQGIGHPPESVGAGRRQHAHGHNNPAVMDDRGVWVRVRFFPAETSLIPIY